ncbi:MAG: polysaccharide deacetylase family protein, partial [Coprobacillus sp.]
VASHTCTHPTLSRIPKEQVIQEVLEDRKKLESLTHKLVKGFSYPNGVYNDEIETILKACGIVYSRTTRNTLRFDIPNNYLHWHPTCHHSDALSLVDQFVNTKYDQRLKLFYIWGHSYEFDRDQNWELIEELADKISFQDDVWYATNIEIYNYLKAASLLEYSSNGTYVYNPSYMSVWLSIDGDIKEIPGGSYVCLIK